MGLIDTKTMDAIMTAIADKDETQNDKYYLYEYFKQKPGLNADIVIDPDADSASALAAFVIANRDFEVLGTNAVTASVAFNSTNAGITLTTAGADNDQVYICPHLDTNQTAWSTIKWGSENQVNWKCAISTVAITTCLIWAGLKLTYDPTSATDDDQVFFRYSTDDGDTTWHLESSIADTDTDTDSGVAVAANTIYVFRIEIDKSRVARCYINDNLIYTTAALTNDVDFIPYVGIQSLDPTPSASSMILHYELISRYLFE